MIEASVDETVGTGVEVHMLQPGVGWIPWWKSNVYPGDKHYRWFKEKTGLEPDSFGKYMMTGGDIVEVFTKRCRERGLTPFISLRLNDAHHLENVGLNNGGSLWISRFYEEHPEYRIGNNRNDWNQRVHNWAIPEVREYKLAFIRELCKGYDIDGIELDFMRHVSYFQHDKTTSEQRAEIMTGFVAQVRKLLDKTAKPGKHRWLCVRVPCYLVAHDLLGIDLPAFMSAGVDMVNLSAYFFTEQQTDLPIIRKMLPDVALYLEMTHCTSIPRALSQGGYDNFTFCRTTDEQFYTTANLAYTRGADGLSTFNFVYYREHGKSGRGPFNEPPFHIFKQIGDPASVLRQPQHYILGNVWDVPRVPNRQIPRNVKPGQAVSFTLDMAPPEGGWKTDGRLRIQGNESLGGIKWTALFNGVKLNRTGDVSEPYPNPYPTCSKSEKQLRAWIIPNDLLRDGDNTIELILRDGHPVVLVFLDIEVQ